MTNPYADFTTEITKWSSENRLRNTPGTVYEYSNLGAGLLGQALTQHTGQSYAEMIDNIITGPLKMQHTSIDVPEEYQDLVAQGHDMIGQPINDWDMPTLVGMGEINSSASDIIRFLSVQLSPPKGSLGEAIALTQQSQFERPGGSIGLGWHIGTEGLASRSQRTNPNWHNGGTGGAKNFVGFDKTNNVGVVVLNNNPSPFVDVLGLALYQMLLGKDFSLDIPTLVTIDERKLAEHEGEYMLAPELGLTITMNDNHLHVGAPGQPTFPAFPISESMFLAIHAGLLFEFERNEDGTIYQLRMHQGDNIIPAPKLGVEQPAPETSEDEDVESTSQEDSP